MSKKRLILWVLVVLTVAFIFGQSLLDQTVSSKESSSIKENFIQPVHEAITGNKVSNSKIRSVAHIVEFAILGFELALLFKDKSKLMRLLKPVSYSGMIALIDESIQFLSDRSPQVIDIWKDIFGSVIGAIAGVLIISIIGVFAKRRRVK